MGSVPGRLPGLGLSLRRRRPSLGSRHQTSRPLTWQGLRPHKSNTKDKQYRHLRLLRILQGGSPPSTLSAQPRARQQQAAALLWQLRCIQLSFIKMNQNLEDHMKWIRVELSLLPDLVITQVKELVGNTHNMMRMMFCLMAVLFLLR